MIFPSLLAAGEEVARIFALRRKVHMFLRSVEQIGRWLRIVTGFTLLVVGVLLVVTPAPGALVILLGLGLLAAEFVWAARLMKRVKQEGVKWKEAVFGISKETAE